MAGVHRRCRRGNSSNVVLTDIDPIQHEINIIHYHSCQASKKLFLIWLVRINTKCQCECADSCPAHSALRILGNRRRGSLDH